jgi:hypothetical protein
VAVRQHRRDWVRWVRILRAPLEAFGTVADGRLFATSTGGVNSASTLSRVWAHARKRPGIRSPADHRSQGLNPSGGLMRSEPAKSEHPHPLAPSQELRDDESNWHSDQWARRITTGLCPSASSSTPLAANRG